MKLRNKKTGEIVRVEFLNNWQTDDGTEIGFRVGGGLDVYSYNSLAELNDEWEDYEETKEYWYIYADGDIYKDVQDDVRKDNGCKEIGNYFETKEEAEKAVEKLKAWKRLKDKGFRFDGYNPDFEGYWVIYPNDTEGTWCLAQDKADLDLLFGVEE